MGKGVEVLETGERWIIYSRSSSFLACSFVLVRRDDCKT